MRRKRRKMRKRRTTLLYGFLCSPQRQTPFFGMFFFLLKKFSFTKFTPLKQAASNN